MGGTALIRRAVALLVAAGLFAVLVAGISADDGDEEAVAEVALKPTQVVADVPEEYNTLFKLQWGGGSLYQLKGRLATMGCMANTIWLYDNNKWNVYNQYNISHTNPVIQEFIQNYSESIPADTLWADCFRMCEFGGQECLSFEAVREQIDWLKHILKDLPCTDDFDPRVKQHVLPRLPHHPDVCIVKSTVEQGIMGGRALSIDTQKSFITLYSNNFKNDSEVDDVLLLSTEIHELCHTNQHWHWLQQLQINADTDYNFFYHFNDTYSKELIDLVGFTQQSPGEWNLPIHSVYRDIYSRNPNELSAELCSMYLLDAMNESSEYEYKIYNKGHTRLPKRRDFDTSKYLTPEIVEWLETYMILPDVGG